MLIASTSVMWSVWRCARTASGVMPNCSRNARVNALCER